MMSYNRSDYRSAQEWLTALEQDDAWQSQLHQLQDSAPDELSRHHQIAVKKIEEGMAGDLWYFYTHQVEKVVEDLWTGGELSLPKLKVQAIWMLTVKWIEREQKHVLDNTKEIVAKLKPVFFGNEPETYRFLAEIQGMKPKQITDKVNQLVRERMISGLSKHRDLWKVLHDYGIYDRSESNWNMQVK